MSSAYERELRDIFAGNEETIERLGKTMSDDAVQKYRKTIEYPFYVLRGAGSLGVDLMPIRGPIHIPIEVKSSILSTFYFSSSKDDTLQLESYQRAVKRHQMPLLYAYRHKGRRGEKWAVYRLHYVLDPDKLPQTLSFHFVPTIPRTKTGNRYMPFDDGLPLSEFLDVII